jgi:hypothetical protein
MALQPRRFGGRMLQELNRRSALIDGVYSRAEHGKPPRYLSKIITRRFIFKPDTLPDVQGRHVCRPSGNSTLAGHGRYESRRTCVERCRPKRECRRSEA